jgi:hypothetical protein
MTREEIALREWQLSGDELTIRFTRPYRDGTDAECVAKAVRAFVEALAKPGADVPEGWRLVPLEMTGEMWSAARSELSGPVSMIQGADSYEMASAHADRIPEKLWPVLLAAAPPPPSQPKESAR